jgi:uncharacterized protein YcfJ
MNKSLLIGAVLGAMGVTAGGAIAGYKAWNERAVYAEVVKVDPVIKHIKTPRESCHDETITRQKPVKDQHQVAGTVIGAVVGGVLGNQVGGGNGKKLATVAGAAAGGYAGHTIQGRMQAGDTYTDTERRCETVYDVSEKQVGYSVHYKLGEKSGVVRMDHDPGKRIRVENGELVLNEQGAAPSAS